MALALVESDSAGFRVQISSQNREADAAHPFGFAIKTIIVLFVFMLHKDLAFN